MDYHSQFPPGLVRLPYNFSGLQFIELTEVPRVWNARDAFMEQVGYKLYMFLPAAIAGVLLGIIIWVFALLLLRTYGLIRTRLFGHTKIDGDDFELKPGRVVPGGNGGHPGQGSHPAILWQTVSEKDVA